MKDRDFLIWLHARLETVHGERSIVDYMHKLRAVITAIPAEQDTPNDGRGKNNLPDLEVALELARALRVTVRDVGGCYFARCQGKTASCTSNGSTAAARAAMKALGGREPEIRLKKVDGGFLALRSATPVDGYATAHEICVAEAAARETVWKARS